MADQSQSCLQVYGVVVVRVTIGVLNLLDLFYFLVL